MPSPSFSQIPDDFLRAMVDATEALRELNDAGKQGAKTKAEENKESERGLKRLRDIASSALPLGAAGLAAAGIRGGVQALSSGGSFGQGFTGGAFNLLRGVTGFNRAGANAVDQAVGRVQGFVGPLAELGYNFGQDELDALVRSELAFTSRGTDEADALSNIRTNLTVGSDANALGGSLDKAAAAQAAAAAATKSAFEVVKTFILGDPRFENEGFNMQGPYPQGGVLGGSPR